MHLHRPRKRAIWLLLGCVASFTVANVSIFPLMLVANQRQVLWAVLLAACYSAIGAQVALHAVWCTLVPLHWIKRILVGTISGLVLYGAWAAGYAFYAFHHSYLRDDYCVVVATGLLCLPLLLLAAQTPLWIMRIWFRWRIAHLDDDPSTNLQPLRIGHLMIATAAIAVALAAAQVSQAIGGSPNDGSIVGLAVAAIIIIVISAMSSVPAVLASLRARRYPVALGLVFFVDLAIVAAYVAVMVIIAGAPLDWEGCVAVSALAVGFFVNRTLPMLIARKLGYRLLWGYPQRNVATCSITDSAKRHDVGA